MMDKQEIEITFHALSADDIDVDCIEKRVQRAIEIVLAKNDVAVSQPTARCTIRDDAIYTQKAVQAIRKVGEEGLTKSELTRGALRGIEKLWRDNILQTLQKKGTIIKIQRRESSYGPRTTRFILPKHWD